MYIPNAKVLDEILNYVVKQSEDNRFRTVTNFELREKLLTDLNKDEIKLLLTTIKELSDNVAIVYNNSYDHYIKATGLTQGFLDQGGFTKKQKEFELEENRLKEKEDLEIRLAKSSIDANELNKKNAKFNRRSTRINIAIGILNVSFFIYQVLSSFFP